MNDLLKLGFACWLAPALVAGAAFAFAVLFGLTFTIAIIGTFLITATLLIAILGGALTAAGGKWWKNRFSSVRRRNPRPIAWHQWR